jgi:excisionase family DNA binding protein
LFLYWLIKERTMANQLIQFEGLSDRERKKVSSFLRLSKGDRMELHVRRRNGQEQILSLPSAALSVVETLLARLVKGERVAVLAEEQELSPTEAAPLLGISRPLVVLRMEQGELPFRYVGTHRRILLKDVLALKTKLDAQRDAMKALVEDAEDLQRRYGA